MKTLLFYIVCGLLLASQAWALDTYREVLLHNAATATGNGTPATVTETTTVPDLGPWTGVVTANENCLLHLEALMVTSNGGDVEVWAGSEVGTSTITVKAGSFCALTSL